MTYELGKELKNAGFPLNEVYSPDPLRFSTGSLICHRIDGKDYYEPTLEELIEACDYKFGSLWRVESDIAITWCASAEFDFQIGELTRASNGDNPEAAVAKLWLALNSK